MTDLTIAELIKTVKAYNKKNDFQQIIDLIPMYKVEKYQNQVLNREFATAYAAKATELLNEGAYRDAINYITRSIKLDAKNSDYHFNRAYIHYSKEDYEDAIKGFDKAIELNPSIAKYFHYKGLTFLRQKKYKEAVAGFDQAIALEADYAEACIQRGNVWYTLQKYDKCISDLTVAIRIAPGMFDGWYWRGCAFLMKKEYDKAIPDLDQAILLDPTHASAYLNRGHGYKAQKKYDNAIEDYDKAADLDFHWIVPVFCRANVWIEKQEYENAVADLDKVINEMNRKFPGAHCKRGIAWFKLKNYNKAFSDLKRALELNPDDKDASAWLNKTEKKLQESSGDYKYRQSVREEAASFIEQLVKDYQAKFKSHDDGFMYGNLMGKWDPVKKCPSWAGITGWLPAFRPEIAKWGKYSYLRFREEDADGKGVLSVLTPDGELFNTEDVGLPIRNKLWLAITNNENLYLYDEPNMSTYRKFEKVAPMLNRIAARIRNGDLDKDLIFTGPLTPDKAIVRKIERYLELKMTWVYDAGSPADLDIHEPGCIVDEKGAVYALHLCDAGIRKLDEVFPLIKKLNSLVLLNLNNNDISDISLLGELKELTVLDISNNRIGDISPLTKLTKLSLLIADNIPITDIGPLAAMPQLKSLYVEGAGISDISILKGLTQLENLSLKNNTISDISILKSFKKLIHIYLSGNLISDISALQNLKQVKVIRLDNNKITALPSWVLNWGLDLVWEEYPEDNFVSVEDNPLESPPVNVIKKGNKAIKKWFAANGGSSE